MSAPVLVLENDRTKERVQLGGNDLPNTPIQWGAKLRREVQRYIGTDRVSAQVMGTIDAPITVNGVFDDTYTGNARGHAQAMRAAIEALVYSGDLIRLAYNREQRWGFLDVDFEEEVDDLIRYSLKFEPLFREPPAPLSLTLTRAPVDQATEVGELFDALKLRAEATPPSLASTIATAVLDALDQAEARVSEINGYLAGVVYYADLTQEIASRAVRSLASVLRRMGDVQRALVAAPSAAISTVTGSGELLSSIWRDEVLAQTRLTTAQMLAFFGELTQIVSPTSTRVHVVRAGESLEGLALRFYGDFTLWTLIADANGLDYDDIEPGDELVIPKLPES